MPYGRTAMNRQAPLRLHVETYWGSRALNRSGVALVHGFTQNSRCWGPFDHMLTGRGPVTTVDLPGHGRSGPATAGLPATGRAIVLSAPASAHIGYSLGGRVLLHGALAVPDSVGRMVLIGTSPGIEDDDARRDRRAEDHRRADRIEQIGLGDFLDEWLALPLFAGLDIERGHRAQRMTNDPGALAGALRQFGAGTQEPLWDRLGELDMPVLVLAGERDDRYRGIGARTADAIGANAEFAVVPDVGHAAHLEDPVRTGRIVMDWLAATD